jgi:hypothetical protein
VTFSPNNRNTVTGTLTVRDNAVAGNQTATVTGTGI